ncbi:MAG: DNA polymerase III subunit gamma/tau [Lachnospiraceae bacterium]|jgi:DNA polymerase-3 subunit gamma/tau|nr:DNA polymerase III subunit gamma/tau [Lachnospiraceae bacterium]
MSYQALYRKFRPTTFEDVKGQEHIVTTLKNQMKADRVGHAYLFCGTRGTGKTTIAKIFARAVNCEHPVDGNPCGECALCKGIANGSNMNVIEIDAASNNGVDHIREIVEEVSYSPAEGKYKVYIIDEVHMLSTGAFNALLKTLEEPPSYVIFILATTEAHKIPITILSRCQRYDFKRMSIDTITERLKELMQIEHTEVEDRALRYVAKMADGSMRDALSLLDQCIAFHFGEMLTYEMTLDVLGAVDTSVFSGLLRNVLSSDVLSCIKLLDEMVMQGRELTQFVTDFIWYLRNLLLVKTSDDVEEILDMSADNLALLQEEAGLAELPVIMRYIRVFSELSGKIKYAANKRILVEMTLIKLCKPSMETDQDSLLDRIRQLEEKLENGVVVASSQVQGDSLNGGTSAKERMPKPRPEAVPDDIKRVVAGWQSIVGEAQPPMKQYLQQARLSLGNDNHLLMVVPDGVASDYFLENDGHKASLELLISDFIDKEISVDVRVLQAEENFERSYVDLSEVIQFDIEEDDSDETIEE